TGTAATTRGTRRSARSRSSRTSSTSEPGPGPAPDGGVVALERPPLRLPAPDPGCGRALTSCSVEVLASLVAREGGRLSAICDGSGDEQGRAGADGPGPGRGG